MATQAQPKTPSQIAAAKLCSKANPASLMKTSSPKKKKSTLSDTSRASAASSRKAPPPEAKVQQKGPSLFALFATKRLVRRLADRVAARRAEREAVAMPPQQPTYQLQPKVKFNCEEIESVMKDIADARLEKLEYSPRKCAMITKILSEEVKNRVKEMGYERYKLVCVVSMGENDGQGLRISSRCNWDTVYDNYVTYNCQTTQLFCTITLYGLYYE